MNPPVNTLGRRLARLGRLPASPWLTTLALRRTVPFLGTAGVRFVEAAPGVARLALDDRRRVYNHIRGIHAAAAALLAEATSGLAVMLHLPDGHLALLTRMEIDYERRMQGGLVATVRVDEATRARLVQQPRGDATFVAEVVDEAGERPLAARLTWAWRPRRRTDRHTVGDAPEQTLGVSPR
ncbi:MAG: DUF4442 domain-containing protein [Myxococcota bacterium]